MYKLNNKNTKNTKNTKKQRYKLQTKKQYGRGILNTLSSQVFSMSKNSNTKKKVTTSSNPLNSLLFRSSSSSISGHPDSEPFLKIYYNYKAPNEFILNSNTIYENSKIFTAPHIRINNDGHFLLVMIFSSIKPQLLWACDFKSRSQNKTPPITYILPKHEVGTTYNIVFKVYKYPINIKKTFELKNSMIISRRKAYRKLQKYLKLNNMLNTYVPAATTQIRVKQVKDTKAHQIFTMLSQ